MKSNVKAFTANGYALLSSIKKFIDDGKISTWSYDKDGDFTHNAKQWENKAWLRPYIENDCVRFEIIPPEVMIDSVTRGIYLGRFSEMLVSHFDASLTSIQITN